MKVYIVCFSLFASFALFEVYDFVRCRIEAGLDVGESIGVVEQKKDLHADPLWSSGRSWGERGKNGGGGGNRTRVRKA